VTAAVESGQDEYVVDNPRLRGFVAEISRIRHEHDDPRQILTAIRPHFADLLADKTWLPEQYQEPAADGGMGSGIGTWLLYRAGDGSLALSALVVPPGAQTPVHDHLAWGLVGLYRGTQDEEVFTRTDDGSREDAASLTIAESRALQAGDFYELYGPHRRKRPSRSTCSGSTTAASGGIASSPRKGRCSPSRAATSMFPVRVMGDGCRVVDDRWRGHRVAGKTIPQTPRPRERSEHSPRPQGAITHYPRRSLAP
jgi:predicted metal-dependent enzyme (double-stranded beta helix superfamily)